MAASADAGTAAAAPLGAARRRRARGREMAGLLEPTARTARRQRVQRGDFATRPAEDREDRAYRALVARRFASIWSGRPRERSRRGRISMSPCPSPKRATPMSVTSSRESMRRIAPPGKALALRSTGPGLSAPRLGLRHLPRPDVRRLSGDVLVGDRAAGVDSERASTPPRT